MKFVLWLQLVKYEHTNFLNFVHATYMSCMGYDMGKPIGNMFSWLWINKPLSCTTAARKLIYSRAGGGGGCMGGWLASPKRKLGWHSSPPGLVLKILQHKCWQNIQSCDLFTKPFISIVLGKTFSNSFCLCLRSISTVAVLHHWNYTAYPGN